MYGWRSGLAAIATSVCLILTLAKAAPAQVAPKVESVQIPPNVDPFNLSFDDIKKYSSMKNFELVGHRLRQSDRTARPRNRIWLQHRRQDPVHYRRRE